MSVKANAAKLALQSAMAAATLWDYRLFDLRVFDGAAIMLFALWLVLTPEPVAGFLRRRSDYWLLFLTVAVYAGAGYVMHGHRSSLAIVALAAIGFILIGRAEWLKAIGPTLWVLVGVHISFFVIQFGAFYGFGRVIDFQAIVGEASRIVRAPSHMRAAGLFQEANSFCLNLFVLTSIAILWRPSRLLTSGAVATIIVSESLWGFGAALLLLLLNEMRRKEPLRHLLIALAVTGATVGVLFNAYLWLNKNPNEHVPYFYWRIVSIAQDSSLRERYLRNTCSRAEQIQIRSVTPEARLMSVLLGDGLSTRFFEECLPANGISFLFKSFGVVGLISLLTGFGWALRGLSGRAKFYAISAIGFSFTSYPLVTYFIFWLWLPAVIGLLRRDLSKPHPPDTPAP